MKVPVGSEPAPKTITKRASPELSRAVDRLRLFAYRALPDTFIPDDLKGRIVFNSYLNKLRTTPANKIRRRSGLTKFEKNILYTPGTSQSLYKYLSGDGAKLLPELVERKLGDKWYTGLAKAMANTSFGRDIILDKVMERTLPPIGGDTSLARQFLAAGGMV